MQLHGQLQATASSTPEIWTRPYVLQWKLRGARTGPNLMVEKKVLAPNGNRTPNSQPVVSHSWKNYRGSRD